MIHKLQVHIKLVEANCGNRLAELNLLIWINKLLNETGFADTRPANYSNAQRRLLVVLYSPLEYLRPLLIFTNR
jgi:hypothetical protein